MKVSVIIPVYNVAKHIEKCVGSILGQSFHDYELILVNDGSSDESGVLCDRFAQEFDNISVIHKENGGAASARNAGLEAATGEYVTFIDADDYVEPDYLLALYNAIDSRGADLAVSGCFWEQNGEFERQVNPPACYDKFAYIGAVTSGMISYITAFGSCCKLFRRAFLQRHHIVFDTQYMLSEDRLFNIEVMSKLEQAVSISYTGYHYMDNPESLTHNRHKRSILRNIIQADCRVWDKFEEAMREMGQYGAYEQYIKDSRVKALMAMDAYIVNSAADDAGISIRQLYQMAIPIAHGAILTPERNSVVWRVLNYAVSRNIVLLLRIWMWVMRIKQEMKK